jgi:hypothetical protein
MTPVSDEPPFGLTLPCDLSTERAERVVVEYARRLAVWAELGGFPRSMAAIAAKLQHRVTSASLPAGLRGIRVSKPKAVIITAEDETRAAQERTIAHEIFHGFIGIEHCRYTTSKGRLTPLQARVENLCEIGAAELHAPSHEVRRLIGERLTIQDVCRLAIYFGTSLAATLRSIVAVGPVPLAGVVFEHKHKPTDSVPSVSGQLVLWGAPSDFDAPRRLRIQDWCVSQGEHVRLNIHKHVDEGTSVYAALSSSSMTMGWDDLSSIGLPDGPLWTESWRHRFKDTVRVLTMIWLDPSKSPDISVRSPRQTPARSPLRA